MAKSDSLYDNPRSKKDGGERVAKKGDVIRGDNGDEYESLGTDEEVSAEDKKKFADELDKRQERFDKGERPEKIDRTYHPRLNDMKNRKKEMWRRRKADPTS